MADIVQGAFNLYMLAHGRLHQELSNLVHWLLQTNIYESLCRITRMPLIWQHYFKLLILLNRLVLDSRFDPDLAANILSKMRLYTKNFGKFQQTLANKLLLPYKFYLQKRCTVQLHYHISQAESKAYQLLNLINLACSPGDILILIGRYYLAKVPFAVDFNIVLAQDLSSTYELLTEILMKITNRSIVEDLQRTHQKMYIIYFNCYFYRETKNYAPKWIKTDIQYEHRTPKRSISAFKEKLKPGLHRGKGELNENERNEKQVGLDISTKGSIENRVDLSLQRKQTSLRCLTECGLQQRSMNIAEISIHRDKGRQERLKLLQSMRKVLENYN